MLSGASLFGRLSCVTAFETPGGNYDEVGCGLYRVPLLVAAGDPRVAIGASSIDLDDLDEVFPLALYEIASDDWFRPRLETVRPATDALGLLRLGGAPLKFSILTSDIAESGQPEMLVDVGLLVESPQHDLLIESRHDDVPYGVFPLDLVLTGDRNVIAQRLARGRLRPAP
jgi:hypothetical protein